MQLSDRLSDKGGSMAPNSMLTKGLAIAQFYYGTQRYFRSLLLAMEGMASRLMDLRWTVASGPYGLRVSVIYWPWSDNRSVQLPKYYMVLFNESTAPSGQETDQYGCCLWFFTSDPSGGQPWVPTGFFFRAKLGQGGTFEHWNVVPKIAEDVRTKLVHPQPSYVFLQYES